MKKSFTRKTTSVLVIFFICTGLYAQNMNEMWGEKESSSTNPQRGKYFADGNYAMFIHWGMYSQIANRWNGKTYYGIGEWIMTDNLANIPPEEYMAAAVNFNPAAFNAKDIVQLAKDAGMKYIIITSKHHDGFAMFDSKVNGFNIVEATPFKRDPMKELSEACKEAGLGFGFYYSHNQDWTYPGGTGGPKTDKNGNPKTFDDYFFEKCLPQVEEITKNYGEIELIWFDTPGGMPQKYARQLVDVVHKNQPTTLVSGRVGFGLGDYVTLGDMEVPLENIDGLWEGIDVTNDSWGYSWYDENWKTPQHILRNLISTVARGGTFMLNVGPDGSGKVPEQAQKSLRTAGKWVARYPQVIYSAGASPWKHALPWGDVVVSNGKLLLTVFEWPANGELYLPGLNTPINSVKLINNGKGKKLNYFKNGDWTVIKTPCQPPEEMVSVIEITLKGDINVDNTMSVDPELGINISSKFAVAENCTMRFKDWMEKFGEWKQIYQVSNWNENSAVTWEIVVKDAGYYHIDLNYSGSGRYVWQIITDEGKAIQNQQNSANIYTSQQIGWIKFDKPGKHKITVKLLEGNMQNASLASISIKPVKF